MNREFQLFVRVRTGDTASANREALLLKQYLLESGESVDTIKEAHGTMDMGATLVLALGTPAITAVARGLADWIRRQRVPSQVELEVDGRKVVLVGSAADSPEKVESLVRTLCAPPADPGEPLASP